MKTFLPSIFLITLLFAGCDGQPEEVQPGAQVLSVFPNPCYHNAFVSVTNSSNEPYTLKVFDPEGNKILEELAPASDFSDFTLQIDDKPEGVYHILLETGTSTIEFQLLKRKR